jgi:hypothetical protein
MFSRNLFGIGVAWAFKRVSTFESNPEHFGRLVEVWGAVDVARMKLGVFRRQFNVLIPDRP